MEDLLSGMGLGMGPPMRRRVLVQQLPRPETGWRRLWAICPCRLLVNGDPTVTKLHTMLLSLSVFVAVLCIGVFEAARLGTHILRSPCTVVGNEVQDVGSCTVCDGGSPRTCQVHPVATARLAVTFRPLHATENVTGWVWYCKGLATADPCRSQLRFSDQLSLEMRNFPFGSRAGVGRGRIPCMVGDVLAYTQRHIADGGREQTCYYSSRDPEGEDVWLSMPSPGLVDHAWFQRHLGYPLLLAFGGLVLLSVLLGCLALEGVELWAAGLS